MTGFRPGRTAATLVGWAILASATSIGSSAAAAPADPDAPASTSAMSWRVEIASGDDGVLAMVRTEITTHGGSVVGTGPGVVLADVTLTALAAVALVDGAEIRRPVQVDIRPDRQATEAYGPTNGSEVEITLAKAWHDAGIDGTGVKVGVIDYFDTKYWNVAEHGPLPQSGRDALCLNEGSDCTFEFFDGEDLGGEDHGVAVVEIVRDMAPGAEVYLGQASTISDYRAIVDWFADHGVRIITRSLGSRFDGPGDGRGSLDDVAAHAVERGITWINSGGNSGSDQYYRHPVRLVGDRVAFGSTGDETYLRLRGCISLGGMRWSNDWDLPAAERTDYDLYVWEAPTGSPELGEVIASSVRRQTDGASPIETVSGSYCPPPGRSVYLEVRYLGGDVTGDVLELIDYGSGFARFTQSEYSAAVSVVDSPLAGVVSVGAIDPPDSGTIAFYSSRGPTNDGRITPQIVAPAGFESTVYGDTFSGTSASAPVAAGVAALFVQAGLAGDASGLGDLLRNSTIDRGASGPDPTYGYGELRLPAPPVGGIDGAPSRYVPLAAPTRFLDTRPDHPIGPPELAGATWAGEIRRLPVLGLDGVPTDGVTSVAVNIVTVRPDRRSFVQALPQWQASVAGYSNLNADAAGQNRANFAIVPVADDGTIGLYSTAVGHLVVDVLGYFAATPGAVASGRFVELATAQRLLDTRDLGSGQPAVSDTTLSVPVPSGVDPAQIEALVVTVTAAKPTSVGWLQAFPADRPDVIGRTSTVNTAPGGNAASTAIVPVGTQGVAIRTSFADNGTSHVIVDAIGYITSDAAATSGAGRLVAVAPARAFDSRAGHGELDDGETVVVDASTAPGIDVPDEATAVIWNLTVVNSNRLGFATAWAADQTMPPTSALNWSTSGEVRAAAAVAAVDTGRARFRLDDQGNPSSGPLGHFLVDVFGYFT